MVGLECSCHLCKCLLCVKALHACNYHNAKQTCDIMLSLPHVHDVRERCNSCENFSMSFFLHSNLSYIILLQRTAASILLILFVCSLCCIFLQCVHCEIQNHKNLKKTNTHTFVNKRAIIPPFLFCSVLFLPL